MQITVTAGSPSDLLINALAYLAENFGGYKDNPGDFLELFNDAFHDSHPDVVRNGAVAVRDFVHAIEGATNALRLVEAEDTQIVTETADPDDDLMGADFIQGDIRVPTMEEVIAAVAGLSRPEPPNQPAALDPFDRIDRLPEDVKTAVTLTLYMMGPPPSDEAFHSFLDAVEKEFTGYRKAA